MVNRQREEIQTKEELARLEAKATKEGINIPLFTLLPQPRPDMKGRNASPIYVAIGENFDKKTQKFFKGSRARRGQIYKYFFNLSAKNLVLADKQLKPEVSKILGATKMPYCIAYHAVERDSVLDVDNTPDPATILVPELAYYKWSAKILAIDESEASRENDLPRAKADLDGLERLASQILQQKSLISFLVSKVAQLYAEEVALGNLEQHPLSVAWARLAIYTDQKLVEYPMLSNLPYEWLTDVQISTDIRTGDPHRIEYLGQLAGGLSGDELPSEDTLKVLNFIVRPNYPQMSVSYLNDSLKSIRLSRYQYSNIQKWIKGEQSILADVPTNGGNEILHFFVSNMSTISGFGQSTMMSRFRLSIFEAAEKAFLIHAKTGIWPNHLHFPQPYFHPPKNPLVSPASAKPMATASPINPFDGKPLNYRRTSSGFIISALVPKRGESGSGTGHDNNGSETAKIEFSDGKLTTSGLS